MKNKSSKPEGLLEYLDAYTGAPARSAIAKLQGDFTDLPGAARAAAEQFGSDPKEAPTGQDLASNMGLTGVGKTLAGLGLELAAEQAIVNQVSKPFIGTGGIIHAPTAEAGARLSLQNPSEFGRVIQLPDLAEARRIQRSMKPVDRFPAVRNIIKGRK